MIVEFDARFWAAVHDRASEIRSSSPALAALEDRRAFTGYHDRDGNPIPFLTYLALMSVPFRDRYKRVAEDTIGTEPTVVWVSTVWIGMAASTGARPALIFETMAFWPDADGIEEVVGEGDWTRRYASEAAALEGHRAVVAEVKAALARFDLALDAVQDGTP